MPRNRVKTKHRGTTSKSTMKKAAILCLDNRMSEQSAATAFNICHVSCLNRYLEKFKRRRGTGSCQPAFSYRPHNKIFDHFQEKQLADYVQISADMYFGLNSKNIGKLAYEFSVKLDVTVPKSWKQNKVAGPDWITDFLKRNPSLFICLPKATSLSRAINFNPENLKYFMDKYESILLKYKFQAHDIYNMDEIRVTFDERTGKIVASRGNKHNKEITSGKNSTVTMYLAINAAGNLIPPIHIFSKAANNLNFMKGVEFLKILKKFTKYVRPSVDKKVLILLDNHESHLCLPVIDFCKEAGILLLSLPPHGFHKLQPLNRSVYRPFDQFLNQNMSAWIENNPGIKLRTYDVPLVSSSTSALVSAATPQNIMNGFSMAGIWPLNRDAFTKDTYFTPADFEDIDDMLIDNVDEEPTNDVIREPKNTINEEPANINIIPHSQTEESFTHFFHSSDQYSDQDQDSLFAPETLNLIRKLSEQNNPRTQKRDRNRNYLTRADRELRNTITEEPANINIIPHLKTEKSFTNFFHSSDQDKDSLHSQTEESFTHFFHSSDQYSDQDKDSLFAPETLNLIRKLSEQKRDRDRNYLTRVDKELRNTITEEPANINIIPHLKTEESFTPSFHSSDQDKDSLFVPETLYLIRKLSEQNNPRTQKQE